MIRWFVIIAMLGAGSFYLDTRTSAKVQEQQVATPMQTGERITGTDKQHKFSFFFYEEDGQAPDGLREAAEKRNQGTQQADAIFKPIEDQICIGWGEKYTYIQRLEQQGKKGSRCSSLTTTKRRAGQH